MNYLEFTIRLIAFAVTLFLLLEFMVACDTETWKATLVFSITAVIVIIAFFATKQHVMTKCSYCSSKISPARDVISNMTRRKT